MGFGGMKDWVEKGGIKRREEFGGKRGGIRRKDERGKLEWRRKNIKESGRGGREFVGSCV